MKEKKEKRKQTKNQHLNTEGHMSTDLIVKLATTKKSFFLTITLFKFILTY